MIGKLAIREEGEKCEEDEERKEILKRGKENIKERKEIVKQSRQAQEGVKGIKK